MDDRASKEQEAVIRAQGWGQENRYHFWLGVMMEILTKEVTLEVGLEGWEDVSKNGEDSGHST